MSHLQTKRTLKSRRQRLSLFVMESRGFAAAEAVLLAVVLIGIALMVGSVLVPAARSAAQRLHSELAGGTRT